MNISYREAFLAKKPTSPKSEWILLNPNKEWDLSIPCFDECRDLMSARENFWFSDYPEYFKNMYGFWSNTMQKFYDSAYWLNPRTVFGIFYNPNTKSVVFIPDDEFYKKEDIFDFIDREGKNMPLDKEIKRTI